MNHMEMNEIKKQFKKNNSNFTVYDLALAYIFPHGSEQEIRHFSIRSFDSLPENEEEIYYRMFKKVLTGKLGKNVNEYLFVPDPEKENPYQKRLLDLSRNGLKDEEKVRDLISCFTEDSMYPRPYLISLASCEYQAPELDVNGEVLIGGEPRICRFLIGCVNEVALTDIGLFFNEEKQDVEKKTDVDMHVLPAVLDGLMYPVFTDRASDVSRGLYFTKTPKKPNASLIEHLFGENCYLSADKQQSVFSSLLENIAQEELSVQMMSNVYSAIRTLHEEDEEEDCQILDKTAVHQLLEDAGVSEEKLSRFSLVYDECIGENQLNSRSIMDPDKMNLKMDDVNITIRNDASEKIRTQVVDGKRYLMIEMSDGVFVNGIDLSK